ncbi:MAG TPA: hypothetical protein VE866_10135 [Candidatus Binatia bacterium]|nr:hypothetical protein [Candidatus Binatia bacterium]
MHPVLGKSMLPNFAQRRFALVSIVAVNMIVLSATVAAQSTTSPQGGAAIFTGPNAVCASSQSGFSGAQSFQPCVDTNNNGQWFTVMNASVKTSTNKTLFVSPSLVTGLYTNTQVKGGSSGTSQTATAVASVAVRVLLDCSNCVAVGTVQTPAAMFTAAGYPDAAGSGIVFDARIQQMTATLGSVITSTCITDLTTCTPEQIDLILSTTSAHSFNFILPTVGSGTHTITVQARLDAGNVCYNNLGTVTTCDSTGVINTSLASSVSSAVFGLGSVTVIPVQLAPGFSF